MPDVQLRAGDGRTTTIKHAPLHDESLTLAVLGATPSGAEPVARIERWERDNAAAVARATQTLEEVRRLEKGDIASLSVALRTLRGVVRTTS